MEGVVSLYDACERSNERPYRLSVVRMSDDCVVGVYKSIGPETASLLRQASYLHPKCRDVPWCVRNRRGAAPGPFTNVSKPHLLLGCLLVVHLAMRIKDASQPLRG